MQHVDGGVCVGGRGTNVRFAGVELDAPLSGTVVVVVAPRLV